MNKRRICVLAAATAIVASLSSCSGEIKMQEIQPAVPINFSWWGMDVRINYTLKAIKQFETLYPEIDVIPNYSEWEGFQKKMYVDLAANSEADVMQINYDWLFRASPDGEGFYDLYELSDYINLENFTEQQLKYGEINGKLNAIPIALNCETMFYNKTIYSSYGLSIPQKWDDLFKAARVMSEDGVYPLEGKIKPVWLLSIAHEEQLSGKQFIDENGELGFTLENVQSMLSFYKKLIDCKVMKPIDSIGKDDFATGVSAGAVYWISDAEYFCVPVTDNGYEVVVGDYITMDSAKRSGWYFKPTSLYAIRKDTKNPEDAATLVEFLLNSEEMASEQGLEKGVPLSKSCLEVLAANDQLTGIQYEADRKLSQSFSFVEYINPRLEDTQLLNAFKTAFDEIYYDNADFDVVCENLYETFKSILSE